MTSPLIVTKSHYAYFDGMRGLAAIFVAQRHLSDFWNFNFARSYLAVDIFFLLSGFVVAHAYESKLQAKRLSRLDFVKIRLIRLYPMFLLSLTLCTVIEILTTYNSEQGSFYFLFNQAKQFFFSALLIPNGDSSENWLYPINVPYWSLAYEIVVNLVYAFAIRKLTDKVLVTVVGISALMLIAVAFEYGKLDVGVTFSISQVFYGCVRSVFGFSCGVLLFRNTAIIDGSIFENLPPWSSVALMVLVFISPDFGGLNPLADCIAVIMILPLAVLAGSIREPRLLKPLVLFLGSASYEIYLFHLPFGTIVQRILKLHFESFVPWSGFLFVSSLALSGWALDKYLDRPIRSKLTKLLIAESK